MPLVDELFSHIGSIKKVAGRQISADQLKNVDILLVRSVTEVNADLLTHSSVKFVGTATIGTDHIDLEYLASHDIQFSSAPGCNAQAVAEYVLCAMEYWLRHSKKSVEALKVGIIGAGNVGTRLSQLLELLGIEYYLNDPPLAMQGDVRSLVGLDDIKRCNVITCHTPLVKNGEWATYHLIDHDFLNSLEDGCLLINSSRGDVVDNHAALKVKQAGKSIDYVFDVWEGEPNIPIDLLDKSLIGTPHIAGYSFDGKVKGTFMLYQAVTQWLAMPMQHKLNDFLPETQRWKPNLQQMSELRRYYDITQDDKRLRNVKHQVASQFDQLRKDYPVRHEFVEFE